MKIRISLKITFPILRNCLQVNDAKASLTCKQFLRVNNANQTPIDNAKRCQFICNIRGPLHNSMIAYQTVYLPNYVNQQES